MKYSYLEDLGPETLEKEYKLFTFFPLGMRIDPNEINDNEIFLKKGVWKFNDNVIENIIFYLKNYLPKYTSAYLNSECSDYGELLIGVSDDGIVHGIPFKGFLNNDHYLKIINNLFFDIINGNKGTINSFGENLKDYVKLEIIEIDQISDSSKEMIKLKYENFSSIKLKEYEIEKLRYKKDLLKFKLKKKVWYDLIFKYNNRLHIMINQEETRKEIICFINRKRNIVDKKYKYDIDKIVSKLKLMYKSSTLYKPISNKKISKFKNDPRNIWFWVTRWKDYNLDFLKEIKPCVPDSIPSNLYPVSIMTTVVDMIPSWIINENIRLFLIKIKFFKPKKEVQISWKSKQDIENFCYSFRTVIDSTPCCYRF